MLWTDERINSGLDDIGGERIDFTRGTSVLVEQLMIAMRNEYEEKILELEHANTRLIEVDLCECEMSVDMLEAKIEDMERGSM